jgi:ubiquinone/menaquinone biosynthesis C-methylase UbiE
LFLAYNISLDSKEQTRLDLECMKYRMLFGADFKAPIGERPQAILDVGTGTGRWAIDVADKYRSAAVIGIDLAPIQPVM